MSLFRRRRTAAALVAAVSTISYIGGPAGGITAVAPPPAPDLTAASDTGVFADDNSTKATDLVFDAGRTASEGEELELLRGATVVDRSATAELTDAAAPAGIHSYTTRRVVLVADAVVPVPDSESATTVVTVDRTAPTALAAAPDLQPASDGGSSTTDNVTNKVPRTFDVALAGGSPEMVAGDRLELLRGSTPVGLAAAGSAPQAVTDPTATEGVAVMTARVIDLAGNTPTAASPALNVTVDTTAPAAPVLSLVSDTGRSNSDKIITTKNQLTGAFGTLNLRVAGEPGATLGTFKRSINEAAATDRTFPGAPPAPTTLTLASVATPGVTPGVAVVPDAISASSGLAPIQGSYAYSMLQTDVAGNPSATPGLLTAIVDTVSPADFALTLDPTSDSGPSNSDRVTRWDASSANSPLPPGGNGSLKINFAGDKNDKDTLLAELWRNGGTVVAPGTPTPFVLDATGAAQFVDPGPFPFTGSHGYVGRLTDIAGNETYKNLGAVVDLDNPAIPNKLDLEAASDTGSSDADDITNDTTPTFMVTGVEDDATVYLYRCNGAAVCSTTTRGTQGGGILATRVGNGPITAPETPQNSAANTSWRFTITQRDLSGRFSGGQLATAEEGAGMAVNINVVIDKTPEPVPASPQLVEASQTGPGAGPSKTSEVSPTFDIARGTGRVELLRDGTVVGRSVGAGEITDPGPLANGTYRYTTRSVDTAGNPSAESDPTIVEIANGSGYWLLGRDGGVFSFGNAPFFGSTGDMKLNAPVMSMATTPKRDGYWLLARDGGVFSFGGAGFFGSTGDKKLNSPIVGMVSTPSGNGYWLYAEDGGVFAFGDAPFHGAPASESPTSPIVAMLPTRDGRGYWLVTKTGKVYAYGSATGLSGIDDITLNFPIVGMAPTPSGDGLWLVASDGGIFALGDAAFHGSAGAIRLNQPIIGMLGLADGSGYLLIASDGGVFTYGKAQFLGSTGGMRLNAPIVGIAGA